MDERAKSVDRLEPNGFSEIVGEKSGRSPIIHWLTRGDLPACEMSIR
jgi:hypothetical protein